jgi:hypothetical protein
VAAPGRPKARAGAPRRSAYDGFGNVTVKVLPRPGFEATAIFAP